MPPDTKKLILSLSLCLMLVQHLCHFQVHSHFWLRPDPLLKLCSQAGKRASSVWVTHPTCTPSCQRCPLTVDPSPWSLSTSQTLLGYYPTLGRHSTTELGGKAPKTQATSFRE